MINNWRSISGHLDNLRVVLVATRNPLNIGAAARAMSNFGVRRLRVVNPYEAAFREARSAVGAAGLLARAEQYGSVAEAVADCRLVVGTTAAGRRELQHRLRRLEEGARAIKRQLKAGPVALLFGSERGGLSNRELSHCHWGMRIPTREVERLTQMLLEVLGVSGYVKPRAVAAEEKLRRLVRRLELNVDDAPVLLGMLRQIAWKLGADEKDGPS